MSVFVRTLAVCLSLTSVAHAQDVVLVTKDGPVLLSRHIPRTVEEIEDAMAGR